MPSVPTMPAGARLTPARLMFLHNRPAARLRRVTPQPISSGGSGVAVQWSTEDLDTDPDGVGGWLSGTPSRWTARYPGWYQLAGGVAWVANATGRRGCWWARNGVAVDGSEAMLPAGAGVIGVVARVIKVYLAEGDYVELVAFQESGGSLSTSGASFEQPSMDVEWVRL